MDWLMSTLLLLIYLPHGLVPCYAYSWGLGFPFALSHVSLFPIRVARRVI